jgi:2-iminobutanoate/2-iminopropanoate deaminase
MLSSMAAKHEVPMGPDMPKPLGPYSQVVKAGNLLFVSGQGGIDPATGQLAGPDFAVQARQAFKNLAAVLRAAGSGTDAVVKTTVFLGDAKDFAAMNALYAEFFPNLPPARSSPVVALPRNLLISIECIALV